LLLSNDWASEGLKAKIAETENRNTRARQMVKILVPEFMR